MSRLDELEKEELEEEEEDEDTEDHRDVTNGEDFNNSVINQSVLPSINIKERDVGEEFRKFHTIIFLTELFMY